MNGGLKTESTISVFILEYVHMYDCHVIITILPKSLKYSLPPSFMSNDANLSSSFKDFPPLERK